MENLKIVKVVNKNKVYTDQSGKERPSVNYYVAIGNTWVAIRPTFAKGYAQLDVIADTRVNQNKED